MEWADDVIGRPRRANAGSRLQELLAHGLDAEEEAALQALSNDASSSDTSFTLGSDEEAMDEVESDFDAEEVAGVLEGEVRETEASVRRAERTERQQERSKRLQRSQHFAQMASRNRKLAHRSAAHHRSVGDEGTSSDNAEGTSLTEAVDLRPRVRQRPTPTIPCSQRLVEARERAAALRASQAAAEAREDDGDEGGGTNCGSTSTDVMPLHRGLNREKLLKRPRQRHGRGGRAAHPLGVDTGGWPASQRLADASGSVPTFVSPRIALYEGVPQRVRYSSGASVLGLFGVLTVLSFSRELPPAFQVRTKL